MKRHYLHTVHLIFYWLDSTELSIERVKARVLEGGHDIPTNTIIRRYHKGFFNPIYSLTNRYIDNMKFSNELSLHFN